MYLLFEVLDMCRELRCNEKIPTYRLLVVAFAKVERMLMVFQEKCIVDVFLFKRM